MTHSPNPNDIWWLARYAHNAISPLIQEAQQFEPSIHLQITVTSPRADGSYPKEPAVNVHAHWDRKEPRLMFLHEGFLRTKEQVDAVAAKVQAFIDAEAVKPQRPLEVALPA